MLTGIPREAAWAQSHTSMPVESSPTYFTVGQASSAFARTGVLLVITISASPMRRMISPSSNFGVRS